MTRTECLPQAHRYEYDAEMRRVCRRCGKVFWQDSERTPTILLLDNEEAVVRLARAMRSIGPDEPNEATGFITMEEARQIIAALRDAR